MYFIKMASKGRAHTVSGRKPRKVGAILAGDAGDDGLLEGSLGHLDPLGAGLNHLGSIRNNSDIRGRSAFLLPSDTSREKGKGE